MRELSRKALQIHCVCILVQCKDEQVKGELRLWQEC